jgi:hypothetical protein
MAMPRVRKKRRKGQFVLDAPARAILTALQHAAQTAAACHQTRWEFALELDHLLACVARPEPAMAANLNPAPRALPPLILTSLRQLRCQNLIEAAIETTTPRAPRRRFRKLKSLTFPPRTCLILTGDCPKMTGDCPDFAVAAEQDGTVPFGSAPLAIAGRGEGIHFPPSQIPTPDPGLRTPHAPPNRPTWNATSRTLTLDNQIIKRLRRPAACQVMILDAFEEEGWPESIYDPLPPRDGLDPKRRLHNAINKLNTGLAPVIHFHGNGDGLAVHWQRQTNPKRKRGAL